MGAQLCCVLDDARTPEEIVRADDERRAAEEAARGGSARVFIHTLSGEAVPVSVDPGTTVVQIKLRCQGNPALGMSYRLQRLMRARAPRTSFSARIAWVRGIWRLQQAVIELVPVVPWQTLSGLRASHVPSRKPHHDLWRSIEQGGEGARSTPLA